MAAAVLVAAAVTTGCSGGKRGAYGLEEPRYDTKISAEAYSFNARVYSDGKPTTFKLEVYLADTVMGLYGRGYLGKGGLRGRATDDSLEVYFPTTNEYLAESLSDLLTTTDCPLPVAGINLLEIFRTTPDSMTLDPGLSITTNYDDANHPRFEISMEDCVWGMEIVYDRHGDLGWRVDSFEFTDGKRYRMWGRRDRFKADASVELRRFIPAPAPDATRLRP